MNPKEQGGNSLINISIFGYVFASLALSGIPGLSRSSALFAVLLISILASNFLRNKLVIGKWSVPSVIFLIHCFLLATLKWDSASELFISTAVAWAGGIAVAVAVQNGASIRMVIYGMAAASLASAIAVATGFDSYVSFVADLEIESEAVLEQRATGLVGNANVLAYQAMLPLFCFGLWRDHVQKFIWVIVLGCAIQALLVTGSRKGLFLALVFIPYIFLIVGNSARARQKLIFIAITALSCIGLFVYIQGIDGLSKIDNVAIERVILATQGRDDSYLERLDLVNVGFERFLVNPILGHGFDMFKSISGYGKYAHNNIIELAVDGGLMMLFTFYLIYIYAAFSGLRNFMKSDMRRYMQIGIVLILFFLDFGLVSYTQKIWPIILTILCLPRVVRPMCCSKNNSISYVS